MTNVNYIINNNSYYSYNEHISITTNNVMITHMNDLLEFYGKGCPPCKHMAPLIKRLEKETGLAVKKYEVWENEENARLMDTYDKECCGSVPFFYNTKTNKWICGSVDYEELKEWAKP